ncbi:R-spondin-2 isoform X2 [Pogoniulus pusillus]|uniref:R-spondin-2 isoform X2 n=1 Tax=Pogoniulus pusillus TaxID=488313 RepID=UPI0030B96406
MGSSPAGEPPQLPRLPACRRRQADPYVGLSAALLLRRLAGRSGADVSFGGKGPAGAARLLSHPRGAARDVRWCVGVPRQPPVPRRGRVLFFLLLCVAGRAGGLSGSCPPRVGRCRQRPPDPGHSERWKRMIAPSCLVSFQQPAVRCQLACPWGRLGSCFLRTVLSVTVFPRHKRRLLPLRPQHPLAPPCRWARAAQSGGSDGAIRAFSSAEGIPAAHRCSKRAALFEEEGEEQCVGVSSIFPELLVPGLRELRSRSGCRIENCDSCFSRDFCTKCKSGFYSHRGRCFRGCPPGFAALEELMECVGCEVGQWSEWGTCSRNNKTCGFKWGLETRTRQIVKKPAKDTIPCPTIAESRRCKMAMRHCPGGRRPTKTKDKKKKKKNLMERAQKQHSIFLAADKTSQ